MALVLDVLVSLVVVDAVSLELLVEDVRAVSDLPVVVDALVAGLLELLVLEVAV